MDEELIRRIEESTDENNKSIRALLVELRRQASRGNLKFRDVERLGDELKKLANTSKDGKDKLKTLAGEVEKLAKAMSVAAKMQEDIKTTSQKLKNSFFALGDAATTGTDRIAFFSDTVQNFPFAGQAITDLGRSLDFNVDNFRSLASVGADFNQSLINLRIASREAFLPLLEFTDLLSSNAGTLAGLFGSVNQGTAQLSSLTRQVRSELVPTFAGLGLTTEQLNDFLGTFLEIQRIQNRTQFQDQNAATAALQNYGIEIDKIAKLTGIQREALNDSVKAQSNDAVFQTYLRGLTVEQANQQQSLIAGLTGLNPAVGDAVKNILATGFPLGEFEQTLVGTTDGLLDNILALKNGEINTIQFTKALENSSKGFLDNFSPEVLRAGGIIGEVGNALTIFNRRFADLSELTEQQRLDVENLTASITTTQESFRQLSSQFQGLQTNVLQALAPGLTTLLNGTTGAINQANSAINFLSREAPGLVGAAVITGLAGKYLFEYAAQVGIIATGVRIGMFGPRGIGAAFGRVLGPLLKTLRTLGIAVAGIAAALTVVQSLGKAFSDDPGERASGVGGLAGAAAGAVGGRIIGGSIGAIGGPLGIALGTTIGGILGQQLGELVSSRQVGTVGATGLPAEPASILTTVERGERVLNAQETAAVNNSAPDPRISKLVEANEQMVKQLGMLVQIGAKTEKNTETGTRRLANMSSNLV